MGGRRAADWGTGSDLEIVDILLSRFAGLSPRLGRIFGGGDEIFAQGGGGDLVRVGDSRGWSSEAAHLVWEACEAWCGPVFVVGAGIGAFMCCGCAES